MVTAQQTLNINGGTIMKKDKEMAQQITQYVNNLSFSPDEFVNEMSRQHRTLQQRYTLLCVAWLKKLANTEYYDDRNKASVEFAKSIKKELDNAVFPFI